MTMSHLKKKMGSVNAELAEMFASPHELEGESGKKLGAIGYELKQWNNCIVWFFDTNALFQAYEKKADFTTFSFNSTFENVIDMINQLDIYNQVTRLAIPSVVWTKWKKQIIEKAWWITYSL